jgi:hypothetical protein
MVLLCSRFSSFYPSVLAIVVRVIALVAFGGCLRLGTSARDFVYDGKRVFVSIFRDKTVKQHNDCHRIVLEPVTGNLLICPVKAYLDYVAECSNLGLS